MSSDPPNRPKTYDMIGDARMDARDDGCGDYMKAWEVDEKLRERDAEVARLREENERLLERIEALEQDFDETMERLDD